MTEIRRQNLTEKEHKNLRLYNILRSRGEVSRADITAITGINAVSISNYTNSFIKRGLVIERELGASSGGRPPILLELNNAQAYAVGVHIAPSFVKAIMTNLSIKKVREHTSGHRPENIREEAEQAVRAVLADAQAGNLKGIGISSELADIDIDDIADHLEKTFTCPVMNATAALAAAYAETVERDIDPAAKFLYSYGYTGDCVLMEKFEFFAKEDEDDAYKYLRPWDLDMGVEENARRMIREGLKTEILTMAKGAVENITDIDIFNAAQKNDELAKEILEFAGLNLGVRLAYLLNIFKPSRLVLGGGVERTGDSFLAPVKRSIGKLALEALRDTVEIGYCMSGYEDAVATGSAALVIREFFMGV